jgi:hypothetical protein
VGGSVHTSNTVLQLSFDEGKNTYAKISNKTCIELGFVKYFLEQVDGEQHSKRRNCKLNVPMGTTYGVGDEVEFSTDKLGLSIGRVSNVDDVIRGTTVSIEGDVTTFVGVEPSVTDGCPWVGAKLVFKCEEKVAGSGGGGGGGGKSKG